jgi:hypothetical protein
MELTDSGVLAAVFVAWVLGNVTYWAAMHARDWVVGARIKREARDLAYMEAVRAQVRAEVQAALGPQDEDDVDEYDDGTDNSVGYQPGR